VKPDGFLEGLTGEARDVIDLLDLNDPASVDVRRYTLDLLRLKRSYPADEVVHQLYLSHFGYPGDLPDLSRLKPPGGNARPDGVHDSHFERRLRGELPAVY
jgi:hypothetical protein